MMKQSLLLLLIAALTASMVSCGSDAGADTTVSDTEPAPVTDSSADATADIPDETTEAITEAPVPTAAVEGYTCTLDNGMTIKLGSNAADTVAALGDYSDMMEAPSCVHDGYDRVYTWSGLYTVTTSPDASGNEYVAEVSLLSDLVALQVGDTYLMIGSTADEIKAAFGEPAEDAFGVQKYLINGANITVTIDGDAVTGFVLTYPTT